jgi:TorA maturation chaperone TorD
VSAAAVPVRIDRPLAAEEAARGDFYALLARLISRAPGVELLAALSAAEPLPEGSDAAFARAWRDLTAAASAMDAGAADEEFDLLFAGVGKATVSVYAGYYSGAAAVDHPRVRIQHDLAALGLAHRATAEPEDHFAALFDAMRVLAAGGAGRGPAPLEEQRRFFEANVEPGGAKFFAALGAAPQANFYRTIAALGAAFITLESQSFRMD